MNLHSSTSIVLIYRYTEAPHQLQLHKYIKPAMLSLHTLKLLAHLFVK